MNWHEVWTLRFLWNSVGAWSLATLAFLITFTVLPLLKSYSVVGCYWGTWVEWELHQSRAADEQLFAAVAQGILRPQVSDVLPMSSSTDGPQRLARRQVTGRVVLRAKQNPDALA